MDYYGKMKELELQAGSRLFKCHRSYLINLDYLSEYRGGTAVLENGEQIPVAKSCRQLLMERLMEEMAGEE
jgi:DNA-binding LytR/AlgR family response regulator